MPSVRYPKTGYLCYNRFGGLLPLVDGLDFQVGPIKEVLAMEQPTAAYIRVSSDKQETERQELSIELAGITVDYWIKDAEGKNPRDLPEKRAGFQKLLALVNAGLVKSIVVDRQDRFGVRDAYQWGQFISLLRDNGCRLYDVGGKELSADDDVSILTGTLGAITSTREQKEKAHRNLSGKVPKAALGEYQGGYPPYGLDVVCFGPDGEEKWRSFYVGHFERWKISADGTRELFKGKGNSPAKDAHDTLKLRPSLEPERLKVARQIFEWYANESISPGQIATRLNDLAVDPVFGEHWNKVKIRTLLKNPAYIGLPTYNKRGGSRFVEYVNGGFKEVERTNGKAKLGRWRQKEDFIQPSEAEYEPLVDLEIWNRVQGKIEESSAKANAIPKRAPNTAELWLKPFLICGHCDKPMRATRGGNGQRVWPSYFCGTYGTHGKDNPTGCRCHRVRHSVLEEIVLDYLNQAAPKVREYLEAAQAGDLELLDPLRHSVTDLMVDYQRFCVEQMLFLNEFQEEAQLVREGRTMGETYAIVLEKVTPRIETAIAEKEAQLDEMLTGFTGLSPRMKERANQRMEALDAEISNLRGKLVDLQTPLSDFEEELKARRAAIEEAQETFLRDASGRQKAEALSQVVDKIVCRFRYTEKKSFLETVEIRPVSAESLIVTLEAQPVRG